MVMLTVEHCVQLFRMAAICCRDYFHFFVCCPVNDDSVIMCNVAIRLVKSPAVPVGKHYLSELLDFISMTSVTMLLWRLFDKVSMAQNG